VFGLLVQGVDLLHLERGQKCPRATLVKPKIDITELVPDELGNLLDNRALLSSTSW